MYPLIMSFVYILNRGYVKRNKLGALEAEKACSLFPSIFWTLLVDSGHHSKVVYQWCNMMWFTQIHGMAGVKARGLSVSNDWIICVCQMFPLSQSQFNALNVEICNISTINFTLQSIIVHTCAMHHMIGLKITRNVLFT